jgi:hypothetical protein
MLRKSPSCMLAGLIIVAAVAFCDGAAQGHRIGGGESTWSLVVPVS